MKTSPKLNRRDALLGLLGAACALPSALPAGEPRGSKPPPRYLVFVGTYTGGRSRGIYAYRFHRASGKVEELGLAAEAVNPTFLDLHPSGRFLYAVNEVGDFGPEKAGAVSAFAIDTATGRLALLNHGSSGGAGPCHLVVSRSGRHVLAANYGGGSVVVLPILENGSLGPRTAFIQHSGTSVNPQRQTGPHAHGVTLSPDQRFAIVPDLGIDKLMIHRFDAASGRLTPLDRSLAGSKAVAAHPGYAPVRPGAGPRHFTFDPTGRFGYVINELDSTITVFRYRARTGELREVQTISTLPGDFQAPSTTAEVEVHPNGRFLYGSNRGHDSLALYSVDGKTGRLTPLGHTPTRGKTPRNFAIAPTGDWLWAANQGSNTIALFRLDAGSGRLEETGTSVEVGAPVCVKFLALP